MRIGIILVLVFFKFLTNNLYSQKNKKFLYDLRTEYLTNPVGLDEKYPRLKWKIKDDKRGSRQIAYSITVGIDSINVSSGIGSHWNTGKIMSDGQLVTYNGNTLEPFQKYYWSVKVWNQENEQITTPNLANFEMGMMDSKNWKGTWISDTRDIEMKEAPYFRKEFIIKKKIKKARVYISAAGLYELYLNGKRVGKNRLDPTYTRFDRRNLYVTHDITSFLKEKNAIGIVLGNGWYNHQSLAVWYFDESPWRARPRFCMDLKVTYEDGTEETLSSDKDWKTNSGGIIFNSIYTGEHYNASLEEEGWNNYDFNDEHWKKSISTTAPSQNIVSQSLHPIKFKEILLPTEMRKFNSKKYIFNLGKNIAGISEIKVRGEEGTVLRVTHSELLDEKGEIDLSNIIVHYRPVDDSDPFQTDIYTLNGRGEETFKPKFNYKGFQFVEVISSKPIELTKESVKGIVMHSDVPPVGKINSSNPLINDLWSATNNSYLSNLFGYPTDCPQREKNGWTGDAHIAIETGLFNFDGITVYEKWLADHRDEQQPNGVLPSIIPSNGWGYHWANGPDWTSSIAIIPWNIYIFYGDKKLLKDCYENIKRYVDRITEVSPGYVTYWGLGDWVPVKSKTPKEFTSTIYYYLDASILAKAAKIFGKEKDFVKYSNLATLIKDTINAKYFDDEKYIYGSGFQTELSTALYWDIVPELYKKKVSEKLAEKVMADNRHIDVGLLGSKSILNALSENGYSDLAYELATQTDFPSWGAWIQDGSNTLFEDWKVDEDRKGAMSRNHIMFGEISAWFYKALGGIKPDPLNPGFKNILLYPNFINKLDHFNAHFDGPYGPIKSEWKRKGRFIYYYVNIPPNSTAKLTLDCEKILQKEDLNFLKNESGKFQTELISGQYHFKLLR